jgi:cyclohexanone monooxygenase
MDDEYEQGWKRDYASLRKQARMMRTGILYGLSETPAMSVSAEERRAEYEKRWATGGTAFMGSFRDLLLDQAANDTAAEFVRGKIREIVKDPATAAKLCPRNHPIGTKRICVDTQYYETYNRPNVTLIDLTAQPPEVKDVVDAVICEQVSNKDIGMVGAHFLKFCGKYELTKLSDQAEPIGRWLNQTYQGVLK